MIINGNKNEKDKENLNNDEATEDMKKDANLVNEENVEKLEDGDNIITNEGLKISNDVVATYAGIALSEVQGVYSMSGGFAGLTEAISGKKNFSRGIKVDSDGKTAKIDISIIVEYGARIPDVAFQIQTMVKKSVEAMTGLKVNEVNVHVSGVYTPSKEDKEEAKTEENE